MPFAPASWAVDQPRNAAISRAGSTWFHPFLVGWGSDRGRFCVQFHQQLCDVLAADGFAFDEQGGEGIQTGSAAGQQPRGVRERAVPLGRQVRLGHRLAELLRAGHRAGRRAAARQQPAHAPHRGRLPALRRSSRPCLRRRACPDGRPLLHQLVRAGLRARAADSWPGPARQAGIMMQASRRRIWGRPAANRPCGHPGLSGCNTPGTARIVVDEHQGVIVGATFTGTDVADWLQAATVTIISKTPVELSWQPVPDPRRGGPAACAGGARDDRLVRHQDRCLDIRDCRPFPGRSGPPGSFGWPHRRCADAASG